MKHKLSLHEKISIKGVFQRTDEVNSGSLMRKLNRCTSKQDVIFYFNLFFACSPAKWKIIELRQIANPLQKKKVHQGAVA